MITLREWLRQGPYTLSLSSSFFGFYAHLGVASALLSEGFSPAKLTGSSAGALVAGAVASGLPLQDIRQIFFGLKRNDFWDPRPGLGFLRGQKMLSLFERHFAPTFSAAKIPVEVSVFDLLARRTRFLKEGSLPKAVAASCSVPALFHPVWIGGRPLWDGGIFNKSGIPPGNSQERVLCIFFESAGKLTNAYELRTSLHALGPEQRLLSYRKLPSVMPHSLEIGQHAYAEAQARTLRALDGAFEADINQA